MSGLKLAAARKPGPTQHRSSHIQAFAPLGVLFPKLSKLLNQGDALSAPCFSRASLARRMNAADRLDPSLLMSRYCLLHPTHHADKR